MGTAWNLASSIVATQELALRVIIGAVFVIGAAICLYLLTRKRLESGFIVFSFIVITIILATLVLVTSAVDILVTIQGVSA